MAKTNMQVFKKLSTARKYAGNAPVLRVEDLYITGIEPLTRIELIGFDGYATGIITARKLDKIGNGNYATPTKNLYHTGTAFDKK